MAIVRAPYPWLRELVADLVEAPGEVARLLTLNGIETEVVNERGKEWERIWVARVEGIEKHPRADKLLLATVDYVRGRETVVTGATNLKPGDIVPYAEVGARLISGESGEPFTLEPKTLRGVKSQGMMLSERELGIGDDHEEIVVLDAAAPVGAPLAEVLGDTVLVCELRPNRADCLGVLGIAREVAALLGHGVREPAADALPASEPMDFRITIEDTERCLRFSAAFLRAVRVAPSPPWLSGRLVSTGMRPINNVVDVTNYVMLETGQPLHAFDRRRLRGAAIRVRRARRGERLLTLDGVDRLLDETILVVADAELPVGIAGIIGGADSEIADDTTDVVLEVAKWENRAIWRSAAALRAQTEAGKRFSWDVSPELVPIAQRRALRLLRELAGAEAYAFVDEYPSPREVPNIRVPFGRMTRLLGAELPRDEVTDGLRRLGCKYAIDGDVLIVTPPPWRTDLTIPEDVIEEAARMVGYERIPTRLPSGPLPLGEPHPLEQFRERVRDALVAAGLQEIVSYPLVDPAWLSSISPEGERTGAGGRGPRVGQGPQPIRVTNPLSVEQSVLRTTLVPSLLDTARRNLSWSSGVALFEISRRYVARPRDLPDEPWSVGILLTGRTDPDAPRHWLEGEALGYDVFALKGILESVADVLGLELPEPEAGAPQLHQGRSFTLRDDETVIGTFGQLHPAVAERWDLPPATVVAEIDLAALATRQRAVVAPLPPRFPTAYRDLAVVVDADTGWARVRDEVIAGGKHLARLSLLDVYQGPQIPPGKRSFAMRLLLQSPEGTLADEEIDRVMRRVVARLERALGASVRD